jgi:hypothetical protein
MMRLRGNDHQSGYAAVDGKGQSSINPGEVALMANAHALEEGCRPIVEEMIS